MINASVDQVRYTSVALALARVRSEGIVGQAAECGVYRGELSKLICSMLDDRIVYLFDTFEGFRAIDEDDNRFRDTSMDVIMKRLGQRKNYVLRKGYFPGTSHGLEQEQFAFAMLDFDKYEPTLSAIEFFYPRMTTGGYIFADDYNDTDSDRAVSRAIDAYMRDKPERLVELPDQYGSVVIRKL